MDKIINMYTARPNEIMIGSVGLYVVKIHISRGRNRDGNECSVFRLYRCADHRTPGQVVSTMMDIPQGERLIGSDAEMATIVMMLFPAVYHAGIVPDPML